MGWWEIGHNDDVIGDVPADILGNALMVIAAISEQQAQSKPTLQEMLDGIALALAIKREELFMEGDSIAIRSVTAEMKQGHISGTTNGEVNRELVSKLHGAFADIAATYKDAKERKPRLSELIACIDFVLGANTELYILDGAEISIERIVVEVNGTFDTKSG